MHKCDPSYSGYDYERDAVLHCIHANKRGSNTKCGLLLKLLKSGTTADTKAGEIRGLHLKRTWKLAEVVRRGRQEVHSREGSEFKVAIGVFWSWKFTWERARIKASAGWPKSQRKKDRKHQFQTRGSCNQSPERESERGWSGRERGGKGASESEGLLSLRHSRICPGRERSACWNLRKDA